VRTSTPRAIIPKKHVAEYVETTQNYTRKRHLHGQKVLDSRDHVTYVTGVPSAKLKGIAPPRPSTCEGHQIAETGAMTPPPWSKGHASRGHPRMSRRPYQGHHDSSLAPKGYDPRDAEKTRGIFVRSVRSSRMVPPRRKNDAESAITVNSGQG
jgi:hypothetical protein